MQGLGWESDVGTGLREWCRDWVGRVVYGLGWKSGVGTGLGLSLLSVVVVVVSVCGDCCGVNWS